MASSRSSLSSTLIRPLAPVAPFPGFGAAPAEPADQTQTATTLGRLDRWIDAIDRHVQLPNSFQAFSLYLIGLMLFVAGAVLHILLAVQILEAKVQLATLNQEYYAIEQRNGETIFNIARDTSMVRLHERVVEQGYAPIATRKYVMPPAPAAVVTTEPVEPPSAPLAASAEPAPNWRSWEALLGLRVPEPTVSTSVALPVAGWETWWQQTVDTGSRWLDDLLSR